MKNAPLGTYFLGATVASPQALRRIQTYTERVIGPLGKDLREKHLTILPPFRATYQEASDINLGSMTATLLSIHPSNSVIFAIRGLDVMEFDGESFLHFPVTAYTDCVETWEEYVLRMRQKIVDYGITFQSAIPDEYIPHITIHGGKSLSSDRSIAALIKESRNEPPLHFHPVCITLYAKYRRGWDALSEDPTGE